MNENATGRLVARLCGCCRGEGGWCDECLGKCDPCEMSGMVEVWEPGGFDPSTLPRFYCDWPERRPPGSFARSCDYYRDGGNLVIEATVDECNGHNIEASFILPLDILTADQVRAILIANRCPVKQS